MIEQEMGVSVVVVSGHLLGRHDDNMDRGDGKTMADASVVR